MNKIAIILVAVLIFALGSGIGTAAEIVVSPGESIQTAVNNAASGDAVIVKPGNYTENIRVITPNLVIKSESGNPKDTVINGRGGANLFIITANNATISGFRIESAEAGIYLSRCGGCTLANNEFLHNRLGIHLNSANNNRISQNRINSNEKHGIQLVNSEGNQLLNNIINSNERGINSLTSNKSTISGNEVSYNTEFGMWISQSHDNKITGNTVNESSRGIHQNSSSRNVISGNIIAFNNVSGLFECPGCHNNRIFNNYLNNRDNANIKTRDTTWNITKTIGTNIVGGPYLGGNFWANPTGTGFSQTAQDTNKDGIADTEYNTSNISDFLPLVSGSGQEIVPPVANFNANVMNGTAPLSVQFWDSSQNAISWNWDFDTDGNLDSQIPNPVYVYRTPGNYTVTLTVSNGNSISVKTARIIVEAESSEINLLPVPDFKNNVINDSPALSVQFTDSSQNTGWRTWYFGDGGTSNEQNPVHIYAAEGTYNVFLSASNENGTVSKNAWVTIKKTSSSEGNSHKSSSSGSSSKSGGGGGAGGSPEAQRNVEIKELSQTYVSSSQAANFTFPKKATCVEYICFDSKKTLGKTTTIAEMLKGKSNLVSQLPEGEVYKSINVWVGSGGVGTAKNIENAVICFKVDKAWIKDKKIDKDSIVLNRYTTADKKWEELQATLSNEDEKYLYFTAKTPEYGSFAITAKQLENNLNNHEISKDSEKEESSSEERDNDDKSVTTEKGSEEKTEPEESLKMPAFEIVYGILGLFATYVFRKK